jgi:O-antigen/teichoic acid export membrane protein
MLKQISILWDFDLADPRSKRKRLIALAALGNAAARAIAILANLAQVPIAVHYLKSEAFGLWMTLVGTVQLMSFADLGMGFGLQNKISEAYGKDDLQGVRDLFKTGWVILALVGAVLALVGAPLCWLVPWERVFKIHDAFLKTEVPGALAVILAFFCLNLPLNAGVRLAVGMQLGWVSGAWNAVSSVVCLGLIILGRSCGVGFVGFVALAMSAPVVGNIGTIWHTFQALGKKFCAMEGHFQRALPMSILRQGLLFLLPQLGSLVMTSAPAVLIASILGTAAVTPFNVCQRLTNALLQIQQLPLAGLWPAYAEAKSRGDYAWVWKTFLKSIYYTATTAVFFGLVLVLGGNLAISLWTRGAIVPGSGLLFGFAIWIVIIGSIGAIPAFLNGCGELHGQAWGGVLSGALVLFLTPVMVKHFGLSGAVFAMVTSWSLGMLLVFPSILKVKKQLLSSQARPGVKAA